MNSSLSSLIQGRRSGKHDEVANEHVHGTQDRFEHHPMQAQTQTHKHTTKTPNNQSTNHDHTTFMTTNNENEPLSSYPNTQEGSWHQQTRALLYKNLLLKTRTPIATFLELFSPALFMYILVLGYTLSEIRFKEARTYASWEFDFPSPLVTSLLENLELESIGGNGGLDLDLDLLGNVSGVGRSRGLGRDGTVAEGRWGHESPCQQTMSKEQEDGSFLPSFWPDLSELLPMSDIFLPDNGADLSSRRFVQDEADRDIIRSTERLLQSMTDGKNDTNTTEEEDDIYLDDDASFSGGGFDSISSINDIRKELRNLLESPVPIPTLTQYLTLANILSANLDISDLNELYQSSSSVKQWGNLLTLGTVHIVSSASKGALANEFVEYLGNVHSIYNQSSSSSESGSTGSEATDDGRDGLLNFNVMIRVHDDSDQAIDFIMSNLNERTFAFIEFDESQDGGFDFAIRMNSTTLPNTSRIVNWVSIGLNRRYQRYYFSGFLSWQRTINEFALERMASQSELPGRVSDDDSPATDSTTGQQCIIPDPAEWTNTFMMPFPTPAYSQNPFFTAVGFLLGLTIAMSFLYPVSRLIKSLVEEKETRMKETLAILGVKAVPHTLSWILTSFLMFSFIAFTVAFILSSYVFKFSSAAYIYAYIFLFSASVVGFSFFVASFFSRAKLSAIVGPIALFATLLPRWIFFGSNRFEATRGKYIASILPCTAFAFGADIISDYEYAEKGINSSNVDDGDYSFQTTLNFLFLDAILFGVLGLYLEQIIPRTYGVAEKWYFCLQPQFWRRLIGKVSNIDKSDQSVSVSVSSDEVPVEVSTEVAKVEVKSLVKSYSSKQEKLAVNNLNLSCYESEIFCLLGHNGAGKSTTMSIMTGLYTPTSGDVKMYGKSIGSELKNCRQLIGICPQQNILFDNLTVLEHFTLFQKLNGQPHRKENSIARAKEVGLEKFLQTKSSKLSGGNKRKLCLGIALCGDKRVLVLDEPTSGMDPQSRRMIWDLLRAKRRGRVILLTTHFMDEAQVLADRIAILKEGCLQCCGSLLFLQQHYGLGYNLTVVVKQSEGVEDSSGERRGESNAIPSPPDDDATKLDALIKQSVPGSWQLRSTSREIMYRLKQGCEDKFVGLFDEMEKRCDELKIGSFGVSNSSLQDIFFSLSEQVEEEQAEKNHGMGDPLELPSAPKQPVSLLTQIFILMKKRYIVQKKDRKTGFFLIILPVILIAFVLLVLLVEVPLAGPPIDLSLSLYSASNSEAAATIITGDRDDVDDMTSIMKDAVDRDVFSLLKDDVETSQELSDMMLNTTFAEDGGSQFGAYVYKDEMRMKLNIDWSAYTQDVVVDEMINVSTIENTLQIIVDALNISIPSNITSFIEDFMNSTGAPDVALTDDIMAGLVDDEVSKLLRGETVSYELNITDEVSIMHNSSSPHAVSAYAQSYYNYRFIQCVGSNITSSRLAGVNHPLPLTSRQNAEIRFYLSIFVSLFLLIPFCYMPPTFAIFVVKERASKSKHLQLVSGVDMLSYWVSTWIWDMIGYTIITVMVILVFLLYGDQAAAFVGTSEALTASIILVWGYGLSSMPFGYLLSRVYQNPANAQISMMIIFFITGFVAVNSYFILDSIETTKHIARGLLPLFRTWPAYILGEAFLALAANYWEREAFGGAESVFGWNVSGRSITLLYTLSVPYFLLILILEFSSDGGSGGKLGRLLRSWKSSYDRVVVRLQSFEVDVTSDVEENQLAKDSDVYDEERFVSEHKVSLRDEMFPLVVSNLWKVYPRGSLLTSLVKRVSSICCCNNGLSSASNDSGPVYAVKGLTFAVRKGGETLGLLGVNGAGKSTTMGILTGDISATEGEAFVAGNDIIDSTKNGREEVGFCPQIDPLLDYMTAYETLSIYGSLRGIPKEKLHDNVDMLLKWLSLDPHSHKEAQHLSGGNRRKLSLGISLIGSPSVVFIDEASSGVDPTAQRQMWELISKIGKERAVIITTHSMEEAEALCDRITIINGDMKCIGSPQHLKNKFLGGYTIHVSIHSHASESDITLVQKRLLESSLPECASLAERHGRFLTFDVPVVKASTLSSLFQSMQQSQIDPELNIDKYSISQCTLEQVFITMVTNTRD